MFRKRWLTAVLALACLLAPFCNFFPHVKVADAAALHDRITYQLPPNPEKYLFLNVEMVDILNPQIPAQQMTYSQGEYVFDMDAASYHKIAYDLKLKFQSSKKGFLWNVHSFIGVLPLNALPDAELDAINSRLTDPHLSWEEESELRQKRAELHMNARLQSLVDAGYIKWEEIDDGAATKEFVAMVLYRMYGQFRPYHGGIDLKDSEDVAVRWAVEAGLPGFAVDSQGYLYPQSFLSLDPGPKEYAEEYAYDRLFYFLTLIFPGKKTQTGWEYYQIKLKPGMVPVKIQDVIQMGGKSVNPYSDEVRKSPAYQQARKKVDAYFISRFPHILEQARKDVRKPRVWDWSRDLIHHPKFEKEVAAYQKNKTNQHLNTVYQAVRAHYNLNIRQDSIANIKSVLENVK